METLQELVSRAATELIRRQPAAVFSGAGVSEESGIPTFRGDEGLWKRYSPALYGNIPGLALAYLIRPRKLAGFFQDILDTFLEASPNPGHLALAELYKMGLMGPVITQNIDDLHRLAGSPDVIELHGSLMRWRCLKCGSRKDVSREDLARIKEILSRPGTGRVALARIGRRHLPRCSKCKGSMRPDVVAFGESLPGQDYNRAVSEAQRCRLMLILGTSGIVYPAASIPIIAKRTGAVLVEINPEKGGLTEMADIFIQGTCGKVLPLLLAEAKRFAKEDS